MEGGSIATLAHPQVGFPRRFWGRLWVFRAHANPLNPLAGRSHPGKPVSEPAVVVVVAGATNLCVVCVTDVCVTDVCD